MFWTLVGGGVVGNAEGLGVIAVLARVGASVGAGEGAGVGVVLILLTTVVVASDVVNDDVLAIKSCTVADIRLSNANEFVITLNLEVNVL